MVTGESTLPVLSWGPGPFVPPPPPKTRTRPEGADNYARGRGSLHSVVFEQEGKCSSSSSSSFPVTLTSPHRPSPRCPTPASRVNYDLGVHGNVGELLKGTGTSSPCTAPPQPRVKAEAAEIATLSQGARMRSVLHERNDGGNNSAAPLPRVKPEGESIATMSKGRRMSLLMCGQNYSSTAPPPRVKPEGEPIASISKGRRMNSLIHEYGKHELAPRAPRIREEAQENANTAQGGRMQNLIHKYGTMPTPSSSRTDVSNRGQHDNTKTQAKEAWKNNAVNQQFTPRRSSPRVRPEAQTYAELDKGKRMASLLYSCSSPPSSSRPSPRVKPEASCSADLDRGPRMAQLMYEADSQGTQHRPACRAVGEQAKKNLWHGMIGTVGNCLRQSGRKTSCLFSPRQEDSPQHLSSGRPHTV